MRRLDYIPACLNLCPLTTFYEGDHNGCQRKKKTTQQQQQKTQTQTKNQKPKTKTNKTQTKRQPVCHSAVLNYA